MDLFQIVDIDFFSLIILAVLIFKTVNHTESRFLDYRLFLQILFSVAFLLISDAVNLGIDVQTFTMAQPLHKTFYFIYYFVHPIPGALYFLYLRYQVKLREDVDFMAELILIVPLVFNAFLSVLSLWTGSYFQIDDNNVYSRGPLFFLIPVFALFYIFLGSLYLLVNEKKLGRGKYCLLMTNILFPVVGGIIQLYDQKISLMWPLAVVSLFLIFINMQNRQIWTDHLTGAFNRRRLDEYLDSRVKNRRKKKLFAGILMDLNDFKEINDQYGHQEGDRALEDFTRIVKSSLREGDFLARYAGDEFVLILDIDTPEDVETVVARITKKIFDFNAGGYREYALSASMGVGIYSLDKEETPEAFLRRIDSRMYQDKQRRKAFKEETPEQPQTELKEPLLKS